MTATSIAPAATAAGLPAVSPGHGSVRWALVRVESRRLLKHPLFVLGTAALVLVFGLASSDGSNSLYALAGGLFSMAAGGIWIFLVAGLAVSRERRDAAQDFYGEQPVTPRLRIEAALLSLGSAGLAVAALTGAATIVLAGSDGMLVVEGERYALRPLELAQGPLYLMLMGAFGVLVGTWSRRAYPVVIGALLLCGPPIVWLPWIVVGDGVPQGFGFDWLAGASVGWHLTGLAGLAALAAAGALVRHDRRRRVALLALVGLVAAIGGIALGWPPEYGL